VANQNKLEEEPLKLVAQNHLLLKFFKMLKCPQNAKVAFAMLKNALMENVKLMKRNSHLSLSSSNQILIGNLKQQV